MVLVKKELTGVIRNVEAASHKVHPNHITLGSHNIEMLYRLACGVCLATKALLELDSIIMTRVFVS